MSSMAEGRLPTVSQLDDKIAVVTGGGTGIGIVASVLVEHFVSPSWVFFL